MTLIKFKLYSCEVCRDEYQGAFAYINKESQIVCVDCLNFDVPEMSA